MTQSSEFCDRLKAQLRTHESRKQSDPQSNSIKLLAYDISKSVEDRELAFRDIEALTKSFSDEAAIARAERLGQRAGVTELKALRKHLLDIAKEKSKAGFDAFKKWVESPGLGIVFTAHPTFSLSRDIRDTLGEIAGGPTPKRKAQLTEHLKTLPYLPKRAPTLQEEHVDTQAAVERLQTALRILHADVLSIAVKAFPKQWSLLTPQLTYIYSWVGYDIDGRTDISWGDALRLRLEEKSVQLGRYKSALLDIQNMGGFNASGERAIEALVDLLANAEESAQRDLSLFRKDLSDTKNLVAAANNLTRTSSRRMLNISPALPLLAAAIEGVKSVDVKTSIVTLRAAMTAFGLGTSRIHFRVNERHITRAISGIFGMDGKSPDTRTLMSRASKLTQKIKPESVNFAALALEKSTAHRQMILAAQIHKYIDDDTPIRLLIAETEDPITILGTLYLARLYGMDEHLDISPLFETADALNNGGRIIEKLLANTVYRDYLKKRGYFAIQTGFSDAGRFMGQIPATLAIERLQSHFVRAMAQHGVTDITAIVFNTHGESMGRGGHPGTLKDRVDYVMSPWVIDRFDAAGVPLCHETSFQGGDGFMWFQTDTLALASLTALITARFSDKSGAKDDPFYTEKDFSWDIFRTLSAEQGSLYQDPNYVTILGGFGQNLLIPTGSRAAQRAKAKTGPTVFNPRQLRAIPHNAILQQMGVPANIVYGVGRASVIDRERMLALLETSHRARSIFGVVTTAISRADFSILTAYGRLYDPGFWIGRAISGNEPIRERQNLIVAHTLRSGIWRSQIMDLANRLRIDAYLALKFFQDSALSTSVDGTKPADFEANDTLKVLHALRMAVIMKMLNIATGLPNHGGGGTSQLNVLEKLQTLQIDSIIEDLNAEYPARRETLDWVNELSEKSDLVSASGGFPHISETMVRPLERARDLVRQITVAITHHYDAFG